MALEGYYIKAKGLSMKILIAKRFPTEEFLQF